MTINCNPKACAHCPWRASNQGKRNRHGFYTKANLARLWSKLRHGERMTCHPTDPRMADYEGAPTPKDGARLHECTGAVILQQLEIERFQRDPDGYVHRSPAMTKRGLFTVVQRLMFGATPFGDGSTATPNLNDDDVQYEPLGRWEG